MTVKWLCARPRARLSRSGARADRARAVWRRRDRAHEARTGSLPNDPSLMSLKRAVPPSVPSVDQISGPFTPSSALKKSLLSKRQNPV